MENEFLFESPCPEALPRVMVLDGCNIARGSCGPQREYVNCAGLLAATRYFLVRGMDVVIFMPVIYLNNDNPSVSDSHALMELRKYDVITFTPARASHRGRPAFLNYDDLYVLHTARRFGGIVVSNDRYHDILQRPQYAEYHQIIRNRRLDVQFIPVGKSVVKFGKDLFYKCLPNVELIRGYSNDGFMAFNNSSLYCTPLDPDYEKVAFRRRFWTKARRMEIVRSIDVLLSKLEEKCRVYDFSSLANTYNPYTSFQFTQMVKSQRMLKVRSIEDLQKKATDANISLSRVAAINSLLQSLTQVGV
uniref:RNase_Zc3h12a domain-containing protein n=1 Tax=Rhabditophanes sp. KR3021 TaxID=114890 RepID=A0AC35TV61_9BILA